MIRVRCRQVECPRKDQCQRYQVGLQERQDGQLSNWLMPSLPEACTLFVAPENENA